MTIQLSRRTVALALAAFLAVAAVATTSLVLTLSRDADAGAGFSDTPPWIAAHAEWLQDNGIADGFPDGTFGPNNNITRGQAAYWFGNYNDSIELVETTTNPVQAIAWQIGVQCPTGKRPVAGGGSINTNATPIGVVMTESYPTPASHIDFPNQWRVMWESKDGSQVDPSSLTVYALCAPNTIP